MNEEMMETLARVGMTVDELAKNIDILSKRISKIESASGIEELDDSLLIGDVLKDKDNELWVVCSITSGEQTWLFSRKKGGLLTHRVTWQSDCIEYGLERTGMHTGMIEDMFDSLNNVN